jgi:phage terminase large subunit-like protein
MTLSPFALAAEHYDRAAAAPSPRKPGAWRLMARPEQLPPAGNWRIWYVRGGRGGGKTWTCANAFAEMIRSVDEPSEWAVVAPTYGDARDTCIESQKSGLILALGGRCAGGKLVDHGPVIADWNRSMGQLYLRNGSVVYVDGADDGALRIQGKNLRGCWADEIGLWKAWQTAWDESIKFAVRDRGARTIASGTPKRNRPALTLVKRLVNDPDVPKSVLRTEDNAAHLDPDQLADWMKLKGTPLGAQELEGAILEEAEGALWTRDPDKAQRDGLGLILVERGRLSADAGVLHLPDRSVPLGRRVVACDPSDGLDTGDAQGLAAATLALDHRYYVLRSAEIRVKPAAMLREGARWYADLRADRLVFERNHGRGFLTALAEHLIPHVNHGTVDATQAKRTRAEPVAGLYHRRLVTHVLLDDDEAGHELLEAQQTTFTGAPDEDSPNALDALVWALTDLAGLGVTHGSRFTATKPVNVGSDLWAMGN